MLDARAPEDAAWLRGQIPATDYGSYLQFVDAWKTHIRHLESEARRHKMDFGFKSQSLRVQAHNLYQLRRVAKIWANEQYESKASAFFDEYGEPRLRNTSRQRDFAQHLLEQILPALDGKDIMDLSVGGTGVHVRWKWTEYRRGCSVGDVSEEGTLSWKDILQENNSLESVLDERAKAHASEEEERQRALETERRRLAEKDAELRERKQYEHLKQKFG